MLKETRLTSEEYREWLRQCEQHGLSPRLDPTQQAAIFRALVQGQARAAAADPGWAPGSSRQTLSSGPEQAVLRELQAIQTIEDQLVERIARRVTVLMLERLEDLLGEGVGFPAQRELRRKIEELP